MVLLSEKLSDKWKREASEIGSGRFGNTDAAILLKQCASEVEPLEVDKEILQHNVKDLVDDYNKLYDVVKELRIIRGLAEARYIDAEDTLAKTQSTLNTVIEYIKLGILENDDALVESPLSMYKYTLEMLLKVKKSMDGEKK